MRVRAPLPKTAQTVTTSVHLLPPPLPSLLPPSLNPSLSLISLLTSHLRSPSSSSAALPPYLLPYLTPSSLTKTLLLSLSHPLPSLSFLLSLPITPSPLHFSLVSLSLSFSHHFVQTLNLFSIFLTTQRDTDYLSSVLAASRLCNWNPTVFSLLVKALVRGERVDDALDTCHRVISLGWSIDVNTFNCLFSGLVKKGSFKKCWGLYYVMREIGVSPDCYTCNILVHGLCKSGNVGEVEGFLEEVENEDGFLPDLVTYNTILDGFCKKRRLDDAFRLFEVMPIRGIEHDLVSYTIIIDALCKDDRLKDAHKLFVRIKSVGIKPDGFVYKVLINGYYENGRVREVKLMLDEMVTSGLLVDDSTCEFVVKSYVKIGKLISCLNLVALLRKKEIRISYNSYLVLIEALCMEKRPNAAKGLLEWMVDDKYNPSLEVYNLLISTFCESNFVKEAFQLIAEMEDRGIIPNLNTWRVLIGCLCKLGKITEGVLLLQEMVKYEIKPDGNICTKIVQGFIEEKDLNKAESILRHFVEQFGVYDNLGFNNLMKVYCEEREASEALELQDRMIEIGFVASGETCKFIIYGLCKHGE